MPNPEGGFCPSWDFSKNRQAISIEATVSPKKPLITFRTLIKFRGASWGRKVSRKI